MPGRGTAGAKATRNENLGTSGQGEQSHLASSSQVLKGKWSEMGLGRTLGPLRDALYFMLYLKSDGEPKVLRQEVKTGLYLGKHSGNNMEEGITCVRAGGPGGSLGESWNCPGERGPWPESHSCHTAGE